MIPHNSQLVSCGGEVVVVVACNVVAAGGAAAAVGIVAADAVVVVVGAVAVVVVWGQKCLMRPCTSLQFAFVSVVVTPMGKEPSWWDQ